MSPSPMPRCTNRTVLQGPYLLCTLSANPRDRSRPWKIMTWWVSSLAVRRYIVGDPL